jgi:hypothetical protein
MISDIKLGNLFLHNLRNSLLYERKFLFVTLSMSARLPFPLLSFRVVSQFSVCWVYALSSILKKEIFKRMVRREWDKHFYLLQAVYCRLYFKHSNEWTISFFVSLAFHVFLYLSCNLPFSLRCLYWIILIIFFDHYKSWDNFLCSVRHIFIIASFLLLNVFLNNLFSGTLHLFYIWLRDAASVYLLCDTILQPSKHYKVTII